MDRGSLRKNADAKAGQPLYDVALNQLTLGHAALYSVILERSSGVSPVQGDLQRSSATLDTAVYALRRAGTQEFIVRGLLTRAWLRSLMRKHSDSESAEADLDEAWEIAERGPMRLFMADIHLYRARLFHAVKPYPWKSPQEDLAAARKMIEQCAYWRRKEELEDAEEAAKDW